MGIPMFTSVPSVQALRPTSSAWSPTLALSAVLLAVPGEICGVKVSPLPTAAALLDMAGAAQTVVDLG